MKLNDLNTALYEKMAAEQDKFRDWLKSQPPAEVLNHAYEYTVREDIVMAMEELELTDAQAQALLDSPTPLADVYHYFEKVETDHMDVVRDCIEIRADDVCRTQAELRKAAIYPHSAAYAKEHGELEQYRASNNANLQCKEAIEAAVREHFDGMYLSHNAAKGVIETYGMDRVMLVLANTVQLQDWDGRYSPRNKEWAKTIPNYNSDTVRCGYALNSHPAVLNGFIDLVREEHLRRQPLTAEDIAANEQQVEQALEFKARLYESLISGTISKEEYTDYKARYTRIAENAKESIRVLKEKLADVLENRSERNRWISHFTQFSTMETLDRKAVVHMIQSIKVIGKKELEITFTYQDEYQKAIQLIQLAEQTSQRKVG